VGQHPTDRIALWQLNQMQITQGNYRGGLVLARRSLEACPHEPVFQTMRGFFLEQSGYNEEGLTLSLRSLATDPTSLYTYHAVGHAYQARAITVRRSPRLNVLHHLNAIRISSAPCRDERHSGLRTVHA